MAEVAQSLQRVDNKLDGDDWTGELLASVWLAGFSGITGWPESAPESVALRFGNRREQGQSSRRWYSGR